MAFTREYFSKVTLTLPQLKDTARAQREIYAKGIVNPNTNTLATALSYVTGILGLIFYKYTASSVTAGVISLVTSLIPSEKDILKDMVNEGNNQLQQLISFMERNPQYDMIEVNFPFIHYETADIRFITGKGGITRMHTKGGWITA